MPLQSSHVFASWAPKMSGRSDLRSHWPYGQDDPGLPDVRCSLKLGKCLRSTFYAAKHPDLTAALTNSHAPLRPGASDGPCRRGRHLISKRTGLGLGLSQDLTKRLLGGVDAAASKVETLFGGVFRLLQAAAAWCFMSFVSDCRRGPRDSPAGCGPVSSTYGVLAGPWWRFSPRSWNMR